ncbi:MAG: M48 family metalloprotease [Chloroflexota bacterium]|nr:M48 family metalloprotease [Chloroflexota bacterium]
MNASKYFRRLLWLAVLTTLLLAGSVAGPPAVGLFLARAHSATLPADSAACAPIPAAVISAPWPIYLLTYLLGALLCTGLLCGLASFVRQWYRTRSTLDALLKLARPGRSLRRGLPREIAGRLDYIETERSIAFCYGLLSPRVCVSSGALCGLTEREVEALLLHEHYHLLHRDPLKVTVAQALSSAFFFLPLMRELQQQYVLAKEIEADLYALDRQGTDRPLLGALYKLLLRQSGATNSRALAVAGAGESINQRLDYLLDNRLPAGLTFLTLFVSSALIVGISTIFTVTIWAAAAGALVQQAQTGLGC